MINSQDLIQTVRQLANDNPTNCYEGNKDGQGCCYARGKCSNGTIGCILGQAMIACDHEVTEYISDKERQTKQFELLYESMINEGLIEMSRQDMIWCSEVQKYQDDGETWADAVAYADGVRP